MPQPKPVKPATPAAGAAPKNPSARRSGATRKPVTGTPRNLPIAGKKPSTTDDHGASASPDSQALRDEALRANLTQLRELLAGGIMLTAQRVQEAMDDAVRRGRMTRRDAEELARALVESGRRQSQDIVSDIEQLLGRGRSDLGSASSRVRDGTDRVLREVDRVRRSAGVGPSFPIIGYDELTAAQVTARLPDLDPSQLRKVRDHERRTANRKSVLRAIDKVLA